MTARLPRRQAGYSARMETGSQPPERTPGGAQPPPASPQAPPPGTPQTPAGQPPAPAYQRPAPIGPGGVPLADYGPRAGAALIDWLIVGVATFVIYLILSAIALSGDAAAIAVGLVSLVAWVGVFAVYYIVTMNRTGENNGQTVGKQVLGIRVVQETGAPMDTGRIVIREVLIRGLLFGAVTFLTLGFGGIIYVLDYLWPLWDDQRRALHDMMAKTRVVKA